MASRAASRAVFVDGVRTPFALASTGYTSLLAVDLARAALKGLVTKTALDPGTVDSVFMGTVIQEGEKSAARRDGTGEPDKAQRAAHKEEE